MIWKSTVKVMPIYRSGMGIVAKPIAMVFPHMPFIIFFIEADIRGITTNSSQYRQTVARGMVDR
jgi:hypothetical protein